MSRRVRRKADRRGKENVVFPFYPEVKEEVLDMSWNDVVDWTRLPDDTVIQLFSCLTYRDRASLASTCRIWRLLGSSPCLWTSLDLRAHRCHSVMATSLAPRCANLQKLRFRGIESADAIMHLKARNLHEISGDYCRKICDATLSVIVARHEALESIQLGPDFCERISSDAIKTIAYCCPRLQKLRLSGVRDVNADAINALAKHCPKLTDIGFIDCFRVDERALGNLVSVRFLSVAGTLDLKWDVVPFLWQTMPFLTGLDVSRTDISTAALSRWLLSPSLKVVCALHCTTIRGVTDFSACKYKNKLLLTIHTDILEGLASYFFDNMKTGKNLFLEWRSMQNKDRNLDDIMSWLEWILSHTLVRSAESTQQGLDNFWIRQGGTLLLSLLHSSNEEVQERAATGIATFVVVDDENASIDCNRAEAVMQDGGIRVLLDLAKSWQEGIQSEAAKAIANLSVHANVSKAVAEEGGINILAGLARSMNRLVAEEAAGGLWNLSVGEDHKDAIVEAGGIKALVDLIFRWSYGGEGVLERAAGALANLAADDKCSIELAAQDGIRALVMLARKCKFEGVQEQAARALANLAAHGDSNSNNTAIGQEAGAIQALVRLIDSPHEGVRQEAAGALWNLSFDDRNREMIAAADGVDALVDLAKTCINASAGLQERAAGALWGLSVSEANSIAIGREGGVTPLIAMARSNTEDVHETAAGALWNLAFNPGNALRILQEGGVPVLVHLCSSSVSKMARFMSALALAYMFDGRMHEYALGSSPENISKIVGLDAPRQLAVHQIEAFVLMYFDPQAFSIAAASSAPAALTQVTEGSRIQEAGHLRCSGAEIGRFVGMLRNPCPILKACAAFALLQFTIPGGRHAVHHAGIMQNAGAARVIRAAAAAATSPLAAKIFSRIVLRNLEHHQTEQKV